LQAFGGEVFEDCDVLLEKFCCVHGASSYGILDLKWSAFISVSGVAGA
jgi:hypothetical protein